MGLDGQVGVLKQAKYGQVSSCTRLLSYLEAQGHNEMESSRLGGLQNTYDPPQIRGLLNGTSSMPISPSGLHLHLYYWEERGESNPQGSSLATRDQEPKELIFSSGCVRLATRCQDSECLPHPFLTHMVSPYFFLITVKAVIVY